MFSIMRAARSTTVRAVVLAAVALGAINGAQAGGDTLPSGVCQVPNPIYDKTGDQLNRTIAGLECEQDYDAATAGGLVEMVALYPGFCEADLTTGSIADIENNIAALNASVGPSAAQIVACAKAPREGRSYYVPRGRYDDSESGVAKAGNFRPTVDNLIDAYKCSGWQNADCSHNTYVTNSRNTRPACCNYEAGGSGLGQFGTSWSGHDFRPYCKTNFNGSPFSTEYETYRCSSYFYTR